MDPGPGTWPKLLAGGGDDIIAASEHELARVNAAGDLLWPEPLRAKGRFREAYISGNRVIVTTFSKEYHSWGHLGPTLLLDREDGAMIRELGGETGAGLSRGRFIMGIEGYGYFETRLYDENGEQLREWRSYGHYIVDADESIRVVEAERRSPSNARVVRLLPNGKIEKGPPLVDGQASPPVVLSDGTAFFVDGGDLKSADVGLNVHTLNELIPMPADEQWRYHARLSMDQDLLVVKIGERTEKMPIEHTLHRWNIRIMK